MSDTILGVLIGSGLSIVGLFITGVTNFFIERVRKNNGEAQVLKQKKEEIYLKIYKTYHSYSVTSDASKKKEIAKGIYYIMLELEIYGSKRINALIEKIEIDNDCFLQQIEELKAAIRDELGILK